MDIYNDDLVGLIRRMERFKIELHKSVSAATSDLNEFDFDRALESLSQVEHKLDWMQGEPKLDIREAHPTPYSVAEPELLEPVENESINDLIRKWHIFEIELLNSQSARLPVKLNKFDEKRSRSMLQKMRSFLENYVKNATPYDYGESAPKEPMSGHGRLGT